MSQSGDIGQTQGRKAFATAAQERTQDGGADRSREVSGINRAWKDNGARAQAEAQGVPGNSDAMQDVLKQVIARLDVLEEQVRHLQANQPRLQSQSPRAPSPTNSPPYCPQSPSTYSPSVTPPPSEKLARTPSPLPSPSRRLRSRVPYLGSMKRSLSPLPSEDADRTQPSKRVRVDALPGAVISPTSPNPEHHRWDSKERSLAVPDQPLPSSSINVASDDPYALDNEWVEDDYHYVGSERPRPTTPDESAPAQEWAVYDAKMIKHAKQERQDAVDRQKADDISRAERYRLCMLDECAAGRLSWWMVPGLDCTDTHLVEWWKDQVGERRLQHALQGWTLRYPTPVLKRNKKDVERRLKDSQRPGYSAVDITGEIEHAEARQLHELRAIKIGIRKSVAKGGDDYVPPVGCSKDELLEWWRRERLRSLTKTVHLTMNDAASRMAKSSSTSWPRSNW